MELSAEYKSLQGEIVEKDIYRMRDVEDIVSINDPTFVHEKGHKRPFDFVPSCIIDAGANIGLFTNYARELYPNSLIIAIEPDQNNCERFRGNVFNDGNIILINKAIGSGEVWRSIGAKNGAGENYLTEGVAYPTEELNKETEKYEPSNIKSILLSEIINEYVKEGQKFIVKLDIEGNEHTIFSDDKELDALSKADYITMEVHGFAINFETNLLAKHSMMRAIQWLTETHNIERKDLNFYCTKK